MYESVSPFDAGPILRTPEVDDLPDFVRARGKIEIVSVRREQASVRAHVHESGSLRVRFPREHNDSLNAVIVNTGGGMTGGDSFSVSATARAGSTLSLTSSAAEKFYRSLGAMARLDVSLVAETGATLAYVPQEAIIFNGAKILRTITVDLAPDAQLLACDLNMIGRTAMAEQVDNLLLRDRWIVLVDGVPEYADFTCLEGDATAILARAHVADGASAYGTMLYAGAAMDDVEGKWRSLCEEADVTIACATGRAGRVLALRAVAKSASRLRALFEQCIASAAIVPVPRSWAT